MKNNNNNNYNTKLKLESYQDQLSRWPKEGHHIMAQYDDEKIVVYQSYRPEIGNFAFKNQYFGGAFSLGRMTWIKPNFLWMMFRNGWATKPGQEVVLAIHLKRSAFEHYLKQAVYSSYDRSVYADREEWKLAVENSNVRLQWDPDHDPYGGKLERRAIQIGLRNEFIKSFSKEDLIEIEDVSAYVSNEYEKVKSGRLDELMLPEEHPLVFDDSNLNTMLKINKE